MAIFLTAQSRVMIQGITGSEGRKHGARMLAAGTKIVGGTNPRKAGARWRELTELAEAIYSPRNCDAARQLYRVTAGLDSMIVGEAEIQGQVRRAHEAAAREGATGAFSNRLFAAALTTGKRVRSETEIGSSRVSVPSVAVDLALSELAEPTQSG